MKYQKEKIRVRFHMILSENADYTELKKLEKIHSGASHHEKDGIWE